MFRAIAADVKSAKEIAVMREAGAIVAEVLSILAGAAKPGVSTKDLDVIAEREIRARKAKPAFLGYRGYTATLCASVNEEVVHGIPRADKVLREGDIIGMDLGCVVKGFYGDSAITVPIGRVSSQAAALIQATRESLDKGIEQMTEGNRIGDIGAAVQAHAEAAGFSVVREFVGHGIGRSLHEDPPVPNYGKAGTGLKLKPGMVLAVEPMVNAGGPDVKILSDGWTAVTVDGALSAHFEHTIAVTEDGPEILTRRPH
ncbi:MAG TPA: type I methionyl aminopeptidase [Elusimicrobiota bacterium]|nr:type I methionyl aminopeptidase [Elusimicrobiota bacterium]